MLVFKTLRKLAIIFYFFIFVISHKIKTYLLSLNLYEESKSYSNCRIDRNAYYFFATIYLEGTFNRLELIISIMYLDTLDNNLESTFKNPLMPFLSLYDESTIYQC